MSPDFRILHVGARSVWLGANLLARTELLLPLVIIGALLLFIYLQHRWHEQARDLQARQHALGKRISEFGERLAAGPLDQVDSTILAGLNGMIELLDADRICRYEVEEDSGALLHKYTASERPTPQSPKTILPGKMPFMAECLSRHDVVVLRSLKELPPKARADRQFLEELGVKSLLLIPSSCSPRRKGALGLSSYSAEKVWAEESTSQLAIAANIIGATLERKYEQAARQESEGRFRYLFAQAPIGIALETMEGSIIDVNPAFCSMIGCANTSNKDP